MADSQNLFVLVEAAAGYSLFEVVSFSEISASLTAKTSITSLALFSRAVKLKAFQPFTSAEEALENINAISEHAMTDALKSFLEMNLPSVSSKKKKKEGSVAKFALGIIDGALAAAISDGIPGIQCRSDETVREIARGAKLHLSTLVKGLGSGGEVQAQLGLGHSYSRGKVKFNPARSDNMIMQAIALLDQMDGDLNTFAMRVKEWYGWHFPELKDIVKDNYMYARCAAFIQDKVSLFTVTKRDEDDDDDEDMADETVDKKPGLIEIVGDEEIANTICAAAKTSMGMECSPVDMVNIINFTQRMVKLAEFKKQLSLYLTDKMNIVAPNLSALIGDTVGARLISKAGSLTNLAKAPASTVQILGAEKALFRALKTKGNTPKYGLIYHSTFIGRAAAKNKGRISRYLANKCSIATRIDSFSDEPTRIYGEKLRDQVEERLKFYETGAAPRKNLDVMMEIRKSLEGGKKDDDVEMDDADEKEEAVLKTPKSKKKKKEKKSSSKKRSREEDDDDVDMDLSEKKSAKKSAKKIKEEVATPIKEETETAEKKSSKKSSKKAKKEVVTPVKTEDNEEEETKTPEKKSAKKSSKKAKKEVSTPVKTENIEDEGEKKKSAKKSSKKSSKKEKRRKSTD